MEFIGSIARKTGDPSLLMVEAAKTQLAREIGRESGLFYVPKVIRFDAQAGVLEFERLDGLVGLHGLALRRDVRLFALLAKLGQALSAVHQELYLPNAMKHELPQEWMDLPGENVFIHGDFAMCNLSFHETSGELVIMDWSAAPLLGRTPTFGTRFLDVLWFASSLFLTAPAKKMLGWYSEKMADAFFAGYAIRGSTDRLCRFRTYIQTIHRLRKRNIWYLAQWQRSLPRKLVYFLSQACMYARFCRFLHRYEQEELFK